MDARTAFITAAVTSPIGEQRVTQRRHAIAEWNRREIARLVRVEEIRAVALVELSTDLRRAMKIARPRWDKTATPKCHHAWDSRDYLTGLIASATGAAGVVWQVNEMRELLAEAQTADAVSTVAANAFASLIGELAKAHEEEAR